MISGFEPSLINLADLPGPVMVQNSTSRKRMLMRGRTDCGGAKIG